MINHPKTKKRILILLPPEHSPYNACFRLARALEQKGHEIFFVGFLQMKDYVRKHGFNYQAFDSISYLYQLEKKRKTGLNFLKRMYFNLIESIMMRTLFLAKLEEWLKEMRPDVVLLHIAMFNYAIPFVKLNISILSIKSELVSIFNTRIPPAITGINPYRFSRWIAMIVNVVAWSKLYIIHTIKEFYDDLLLFLSFGFSYKEHRPESIYRKNNVHFKWGEWGKVLQIPQLVFFPEEFDFPDVPQWVPVIHIHENIIVKNIDQHEDFHYWHEDPRPKIYCSIGSYHHIWPDVDRRRFYSGVINSVTSRTDWKLMIQILDKDLAESFLPVPDHIKIVTSYVPQAEILSTSALFITHGGASSIREALYHGVPMIVVPYISEQPGMAARVEYHKLGLRVNLKKITAELMYQLISEILTNRSFQENSTRLAQLIHENNTCEHAIQFIENYFIPI